MSLADIGVDVRDVRAMERDLTGCWTIQKYADIVLSELLPKVQPACVMCITLVTTDCCVYGLLD